MFERDEGTQGQETDTSSDVDSVEDFSEDPDDGESHEESAEVESEGEEDEEEELEHSEDEESEEQDEDPEEEETSSKVSAFKNKNGNFDWKKINKAVGGDELEKSFTESQRTITRLSQEKKDLGERAQAFGQKAEMFDTFDQIYRSNPKVQAAVEEALNQRGSRNQGIDFSKLPDGIDKNDPVVPMIMQLAETVQALTNQSRQEQERIQHSQYVSDFRQGLIAAKDNFVQLVGREPTEEELRAVAGKMKAMGVLDGALLVPGLFVQEIQKSATQKFYASREKKRNLSKNIKSSRQGGTSKPKGLKAAFEQAWADTGGID